MQYLRLALAFLAALPCALGTAATQQPSDVEPRPRARVWEVMDPWTRQTGAQRALLDAGFAVKSLNAGAPLAMQLKTFDALVLGSFVSEAPAYARFWTDENVAALLTWIADGGTVVQMTQADQTEAVPVFLQSGRVPGVSATRSDVDFPAILALAEEHPVIAPLVGSNAAMTDWGAHHRAGAWESFASFEGMRVLAGQDKEHRRPAILEGQHGKGRIVLAALHLDKLHGFTEDGAKYLAAPPSFVDASRRWFGGLRDYVALVRAGRAPEVTPTAPWTPPAPEPFVEGSFTLAVLPDTQVYAERYPQHFVAQTRWIVEQRKALNIQYVLHLGDITNRNTPEQWARAKEAMEVLDAGGVPYAMAPGNHDYGPGGNAATRDTMFNDTFPLSNYADWPTFGGTHQTGKLDSSYHVFTTGEGDTKRQFLILALEWGPRDSCVAWANDVVKAHRDHEVILITHAYMFSDETRYDWATRGSSQTWNPHSYGVANLDGGVYDGEELWQSLVSLYPGFRMTLNGHVLNDGQALLSSEGKHGNTVHQMLCNYQTWHEGGDGYLRLYEFRPDGTVQAKSYSPVLDQWLTAPDQQFLLEFPAPVNRGQAGER